VPKKYIIVMANSEIIEDDIVFEEGDFTGDSLENLLQKAANDKVQISILSPKKLPQFLR